MNRHRSTPSQQAQKPKSTKDTLSEAEVVQTPSSRSENVRVVVRLRPMNEFEMYRKDINCLRVQSPDTLEILGKMEGGGKYTSVSFTFNHVLDASASQEDCFHMCGIYELIDATIEGFSTTVFAYGQTGSGKTYTMAGKDDIFTNEVYKPDEREGIIPRALQLLWRKIKQQKQSVLIKASFTEIYNEQIKDLLNLASGVLQCRWNPSNGFFVYDLIVVDCSTIDDMISVMLYGIKNRRSGSHELNKDSSRSHSIMTLYVVSEVSDETSRSVKKYGKISFVDLAGSYRLKESKSQGEMIKETANINKSLFALGKVIKGLTDRKAKTPYIPYRDSKLTMLLMDSLGYLYFQFRGNSKALMIACVTPSYIYFDETLSTLNYAARTMNIRNKPVVQMDQKEQTITDLQTEIEGLRRYNVRLRELYTRMNKGVPLKMPELNGSSMARTMKPEQAQSNLLPPLEKSLQMRRPSQGEGTERKAFQGNFDAVMTQFQLKFYQFKKENTVIRAQKEESEEMYHRMMETNASIQRKLENLEQIFLNKKKQGKIGEDKNSAGEESITSSLLNENSELKRKLRLIYKEKIDLGLYRSIPTSEESQRFKQENDALQRLIEQLQDHEKELLDDLHRKH